VVTADVLTATSPGGIGDDAAGSHAAASVAKVNVLNGVVTCDLVVAMTSSHSDGRAATSSPDGSTLLGLAVAGVPMGDVLPAPNTSIPVPGVGTVVLNEQVPTGDGISTSGLQLNMIHVYLGGLAPGEVVVGSARSEAGFAPTP
jgi:hypothetical protein